MSGGRLGFGLAAAVGPAVAAAVAPEVEHLGYATIWTNDTPGADGLVVAKAMLEASERIRVGVGVIPCDARPADTIAADLERLGIALERLVLGVGSGRSRRPLDDVRLAVAALRRTVGPTVVVAVAALGPRMCRLAGEVADVVLLNLMTPARIAWARERVAESGRRAGRPAGAPEVAAYVRVAVGAGARDRLAAEAARYLRIPQYARSFEAMHVEPATVGVAAAEAAGAAAGLGAYRALCDETVVRALPDPADLAAGLLAVARAAAHSA